ncbi:MAG: glycosyltransferase [Elusimicrobia bacterium]|nr:glycosyltransferase [Elusimicrobiota bacterium]
MASLEDYKDFAGADAVDELRLLAQRLRGRTLLHVNSTAVGGGVAEILNRMVPLFNELEMPARWEVMKGGEEFYAATKKFHNALHGDPHGASPRDFQAYEEATDENLKGLALDSDFVFIHDPQPAALVKKRGELKNRWLWRCHIDLSHADPGVWGFLRPYVERYDACVISSPAFAQTLSIPQMLVAPSIDPLSDKNRDLDDAEVRLILERLKIPLDKPLVTQVSRFDRLKDPLGVIRAFRSIQKSVRARLLLVGGSADDDPEGAQVYREALDAAGSDEDILVLSLPPTSHLEINAIQRASAVILQKSLREGFGLTVSEALWKGKPVIAGAVGGIPQQIMHRRSGVLVHSIEGAAYWMRQLLQQPDFARRLGQNGREHVRRNFLLTRHLRDYLLLFLSAENRGSDFIRL